VAILTQRLRESEPAELYTLPIGMQRTMTETNGSDSTSQVTIMRYRKVLPNSPVLSAPCDCSESGAASLCKKVRVTVTIECVTVVVCVPSDLGSMPSSSILLMFVVALHCARGGKIKL
jgi:hypothetical protein